MNFTSDPSTALQLARLQQARVRASFPRSPRRPRRLFAERRQAPTVAPRLITGEGTSASSTGRPQQGSVAA